tara:strand:+ start:38710 stop:39339 length:630 start_codon:yes stop_codon:yes gene_type:complete
MKISRELAELVGIIIGDGNIYYNSQLKKYYFEITGNPALEKNYYEYVSDLVYEITSKRPTIRINGRGLRLRLYSKSFVEFLIKTLKLPYGKIKGTTIQIPEAVLSQNWDTLKFCIRGITDTDGSLFLAKKTHKKDYPCIEISTTSKNLAYQLKNILTERYRIGFRKFSPVSFRDKYIISANGEKMVNQWIEDIGFSNKYKPGKYGSRVI